MLEETLKKKNSNLKDDSCGLATSAVALIGHDELKCNYDGIDVRCITGLLIHATDIANFD